MIAGLDYKALMSKATNPHDPWGWEDFQAEYHCSEEKLREHINSRFAKRGAKEAIQRIERNSKRKRKRSDKATPEQVAEVAEVQKEPTLTPAPTRVDHLADLRQQEEAQRTSVVFCSRRRWPTQAETTVWM